MKRTDGVVRGVMMATKEASVAMMATNEANVAMSNGGEPGWRRGEAAATNGSETRAIGQQRGGGTLLMVVILLMMGSLLLHATRRQLSDNLSLVAGEGRYYRESAAAASALAWGERLNWPRSEGWQCQRLQPQGWRACLRSGETRADNDAEPRSLLYADSGERTLALWRWLGGTAPRLHPLAHGWLDFCPLKESGACQIPAAAAGP